MILISCFHFSKLSAENIDKNVLIQKAKIESEECRLVLSSRVEEIRNMDKSLLNSSEKRELKKELRAIQNDIKASQKSEKINGNGGVYISLSGLLIIIILLIIIF